MKKTQIIIITIALVLILGCVATFAVLYFATDTFKADKDLFYKYASQIKLKEFIDLESYKVYSERLKTSGYANEGKFSIEMAQGEEVISETIKYNGYSDPVNKTENYDISINKDNETLLAMNYLNIQDFYGILFKDVVNQYVVFENNNLKEFGSKMGVEDTSGIPNKIEIPEVAKKINYQEINTIIDTYLNIAMEEVPEENYSKIKKQDISLGDEKIEADGYQLKLKLKDIQRISIKLLENAKNDEKIFNLINSEGNINFGDYQKAIDELLLELSEEVPKEENDEVITISVYKDGKDTVKLSLELSIEETEVDLEFSVENTNKGLALKILLDSDAQNYGSIIIAKTVNSAEQENFEIIASETIDGIEKEMYRINLSRNGELTSNNVSFDLSIFLKSSLFTDVSLVEVEDEDIIDIAIKMQNSMNFAGVPLEGEFVQGNHLVINGLELEQLTNLFTNLGSLLGEKLKEEMFVKLIIETTTVNNEILDRAKQASQAAQNESQQEYQNAIEIEQQISNEMSGIGGQ